MKTDVSQMRRRPSSRLLITDRSNRVLLFRFKYHRGPLAGQDYWATPGGALEAGESFADAARRELFEETGILTDTVGLPVAEGEFAFRLLDGEYVLAQERFFLIRATAQTISRDHWTPLETEVMVDHRWWSVEELTSTSEVVYPETLVTILAGLDHADIAIPKRTPFR
jgi:8-oxo-dGTP diphosphatase